MSLISRILATVSPHLTIIFAKQFASLKECKFQITCFLILSRTASAVLNPRAIPFLPTQLGKTAVVHFVANLIRGPPVTKTLFGAGFYYI